MCIYCRKITIKSLFSFSCCVLNLDNMSVISTYFIYSKLHILFFCCLYRIVLFVLLSIFIEKFQNNNKNHLNNIFVCLSSPLHFTDDGRVKYKVIFDEKGKSLVSGHHIASETNPKLDHLYVGARVLIQSPEDGQCFLPGLLAELPSRKNRLR